MMLLFRHAKQTKWNYTISPAQTLEDRTFIHQAGQLGSPVTIGLQENMLVAIQEKVEGGSKMEASLLIKKNSFKRGSIRDSR